MTIEELLRQAFQLGQQFVHDTNFNEEKEPVNFNEWFASEEAQKAIRSFTGNERIICAAVWYKELEIKKELRTDSYLPKNIDRGVVFCGHRHGQCIYTKCAITGLRDAESGENQQGFLTSKNRFVSRREALEIALREGQVIDPSKIRGNRLYSEDIY